jgi:hypothetical protein
MWLPTVSEEYTPATFKVEESDNIGIVKLVKEGKAIRSTGRGSP